MAQAVKIFKHFETPKQDGLYHRLICLTGPNKGIAYFLMSNRVVMGRSDKADIRVMDIKSSREHAEIVVVGKDYVITDLGSQNGLVVNDLKIQQHILNNGDKVIIGQTVYKFSTVEVNGHPDKNVPEVPSEDFEDPSFDEKPKGKKSNLILSIVILAAISIIFLDDSGTSKTEEGKQDSQYKVNELNDPFVNALKNQKKEDRNSQEKLNVYFHQGLREYREGNYFRAIAEFQHALSWSPGDALAEFYLRKTREALDKQIEAYFLNAKRDEQSLKFQGAIVSYCSIVRLLYNYKDDERYKNAIEGIKSMERALGQEEGQVECFEVGKKATQAPPPLEAEGE